jgi:hypothetical protein
LLANILPAKRISASCLLTSENGQFVIEELDNMKAKLDLHKMVKHHSRLGEDAQERR